MHSIAEPIRSWVFATGYAKPGCWDRWAKWPVGGQRTDRIVLVDHATRTARPPRLGLRAELATAIFEWIEGWYNPPAATAP